MAKDFNSSKIYSSNFFDFRKKENNQRMMIDNMYNRTIGMFGHNNLPDTIPEIFVERFLQYNGFLIYTDKPDGVQRIFYGGLGGEPDYLYRPTIATVANPALKWDAQLKICWDESTIEDSDCVIVYNDPLLLGMKTLYEKYSSMLAENELSIWMANMLSRVPWVLSSKDSDSIKNGKRFIDDIIEGKLSVIGEGVVFEGIKEHQLSNNQDGNINALIQLHQYFLAEFFNQVGLNAMQNGMKKEAISDSEEQMNQDVLRPLCDIWKECRDKGWELVNKKYGQNIECVYKSTWKDNEIELELTHEELRSEIDENRDGETDNRDKDGDSTESARSDSEGEDKSSHEDVNSGEGDSEVRESDGESNSEELDINININVDDDNIEDKEEEENEGDNT